LRNIEKKNIAVTLLVIVKTINCKMTGKKEGIVTLPLQPYIIYLFIYLFIYLLFIYEYYKHMFLIKII
jgi:hypothetical protein